MRWCQTITTTYIIAKDLKVSLSWYFYISWATKLQQRTIFRFSLPFDGAPRPESFLFYLVVSSPTPALLMFVSSLVFEN